MAKTSMFTRARLQLPLSPAERAFLKILKGLVVTAITAAFMAAAQLVSAGGVVDWSKVILASAVAFGSTLAFALDKYWSAQGDNPAATLAGDVGTVIQQLGQNDVKQPS